MDTRWEIEAELTQHFSEILREDGGDRSRDIEQIIRLIPRLVTVENNEMLNKSIGMQEVEEAVNQMALGKAPGPDGFTSNFFHFLWDLVKKDVLNIVEESRTKKGSLKHSMLPSSPSSQKRSTNLGRLRYAMSYTRSSPKSLLRGSNPYSRCL